jgi:hypothetical protein
VFGHNLSPIDPTVLLRPHRCSPSPCPCTRESRIRRPRKWVSGILVRPALQRIRGGNAVPHLSWSRNLKFRSPGRSGWLLFADSRGGHPRWALKWLPRKLRGARVGYLRRTSELRYVSLTARFHSLQRRTLSRSPDSPYQRSSVSVDADRRQPDGEIEHGALTRLACPAGCVASEATGHPPSEMPRIDRAERPSGIEVDKHNQHAARRWHLSTRSPNVIVTLPKLGHRCKVACDAVRFGDGGAARGRPWTCPHRLVSSG